MAKSLEDKIHEIGEWLGPGTINAFGKQFAGKDTQLGRLAVHYRVPVIGGGDILRNSVIPPDVKAIIDAGGLAPTDRYKEIVLPYLGQEAFQSRPLLLSSVGRMYGEEEGVLIATEAAGHPMKAAPYLLITNDEAFRRMASAPSRGRADDTDTGLQRRLDAFEEHTVPVLGTYENLGLLVEVDAMQPKEVVFSSMVHLLHERAMASS